jgi:predicted TIM-barrel fold metal-dependent hydrolase
VGSERVLFGTDLPGAAFITNLAKVVAADIDRAAMHRILYANAVELLS